MDIKATLLPGSAALRMTTIFLPLCLSFVAQAVAEIPVWLAQPGFRYGAAIAIGRAPTSGRRTGEA